MALDAPAIGLAIQEGKLSLDDPVPKFFPVHASAEPPENLKAMKVLDLLTMTCGHDTEPKAVGGAPTDVPESNQAGQVAIQVPAFNCLCAAVVYANTHNASSA